MSAPNRLHVLRPAAPLMTGSLRRAARLDVCSTQGRCCLCWAKTTLLRVPYFSRDGRWPIEDEFSLAALALKADLLPL